MAEGQALKRRGILAAAGAVMAGIMAKQTAQPVAAGGTDHGALIIAESNTESSGAGTGLTWAGGTITQGAALSVGDTGGPAAQHYTAMVSGVSTNGMSSTGVYGEAASYGVQGYSASSYGVYGDSPSGDGVHGTSNSGNGVKGIGLFTGIGVFGGSDHGIGMHGEISSGTSAANTVAVEGINPAKGSGGIGVKGTSTNGIGVYGSTAAAGQFGVIGQTLVDNAFGLAGIANTNGSAAFAGGTTNASSYAASFQGHVQVFGGAFDVFPMGNKHGLAQHPDGSVRTFYSVESPECWVEDFGEGTLAAGKAEITLDADFAALVHTDTYHVFVTPHVEQHVHVSQRTASGFVVEASAALAKVAGVSGAGSGTFSWRVVAKPKTEAKVERLAKATLAPKIDFTKLPKPPAPPPVAPTPPKKP